jgi:hypothetical protein|tara:strand:- start:705 stop:875 length:171 start_codon:yes stop_codon:yes gene_type:complete
MTVGKIRKGIEVKDQGFVPYNAPKEQKTPNVSKATKVSGKAKGMGGAVRGGKYVNC